MPGRMRFDIRQAGKQLLIVFGVIAVANLAFYFFLTRPTLREYRALLATEAGHEQLEERRQQVEQREAFLLGLRRAKDDLRALRGEILSTRNQRLVDVQAELARLCRAHRISLDSVNYNSEDLIDEELDRFAMSVPLEGGYDALRRFLRDVEDSTKFLIVERVALARGKQGGVLLQLNIGLVTYFNMPEDMIERKRLLNRTRRTRGA